MAIRRTDPVMVYRSNKDRKWYWQRRSGWNGQIIATGGQGYHNHSECMGMARKINKRARFKTMPDTTSSPDVVL